MGLVSGNLLFENNTYYGNIANEYTDFTTSFFVSMTIINCRFLNETALSHTRSGFIGLYKNSIGYFKNVHFKVLI